MGRGKQDGFSLVMGTRRGTSRRLEEEVARALEGRATFVIADMSGSAMVGERRREIQDLFGAMERLVAGGSPLEALGCDSSGLHPILSASATGQENAEGIGLIKGRLVGGLGDGVLSAVERASEMAPSGARIIVVTDSASPLGLKGAPGEARIAPGLSREILMDATAGRLQPLRFVCHGHDASPEQFEKAYGSGMCTMAPGGDLLRGLCDSLKALPDDSPSTMALGDARAA
jgi:hypothetical protein